MPYHVKLTLGAKNIHHVGRMQTDLRRP